MKNYVQNLEYLKSNQHTWLITGVAGFIGSNLLEVLLANGQKVVGLDNFSTGHRHNLLEVQRTVKPSEWDNFQLFEGDICDLDACKQACLGVDHVLHQAALGSVPRSLNDPIISNNSNVTGFLNMLVASRDEQVKSFTYAASSSTYGDHPALPKVEDVIGKPLSPYAVTKLVNELYAEIFSKCYGFHASGLRYFNVFGPRQDPAGSYAAVIPKWAAAMIADDTVTINGDGETSRDFCFIANVVQANIQASLSNTAQHQVYNVAVGDRTSLNQLFGLLKESLASHGIHYDKEPKYLDFRAGDVRHSQASIEKITETLNYEAQFDIRNGIKAAVKWYVNNEKRG